MLQIERVKRAVQLLLGVLVLGAAGVGAALAEQAGHAASGVATEVPHDAARAALLAAQADPTVLQQAWDAGRKAAFFCANCHGEMGVSTLPEVPNLAGQNALYLLEQTRKFEKGERQDAFMQGLIKVLSTADKVNIALFYAAQQPPPGMQPAQQVAAGRQTYVKLCARCHGDAGHGSTTIPRLAGQHPLYLVNSTLRYRNRSGERRDAQMSSAVAPLKDEDVRAVAAYLNSLR